MITFRLKRLVEKLLSFKFVIFVISTFLRVFGFIGNGEWLTIAIFVIGGHVGMKTFYRIREGGYDDESFFERSDHYKRNSFPENMETVGNNEIEEMAEARRKEVSDLIGISPASDIAERVPAVRGTIDNGIERFRDRCKK